jgi:hyperosmotically inducible periplasmic protein
MNARHDAPSHSTLGRPGAWSLATLLALSTALAACQGEPAVPHPGQTVGQKIDGAIAGAQQSAEAAKSEALGHLGKAMNKAETVMADATITASVKARLATDADLGSAGIEVSTQAGKVSLSGQAPSETARERAAELARSVAGVSGVDNQLVLKPS